MNVSNQIIKKCIFGRCIIDHFGVTSEEKVNIYANFNYSAISVLKINENLKNEETNLLKKENMSPIFKEIHLLHADDCPMMLFNKSLEATDLSLTTNYQLKLASVAIIQDKQVNLFKK